MTYPTNQIPSTNPQNLVIATPIGLQSAPRDPTAQDNTFVVGSEWQNTVTKMFWKCSSTSFSGAVWTPFIPSAAGTVSELTGNSGGAVGPDGSGNINVVGDGTTVTIAGNPGTHTLTASLVGGGVASQSYVTNLNSPVVPTAAGVIDLNASTSTYTDGAVANTIKIELQGTNHAMFVGRGTHSPATTIAAGTNGQVVVGATGADPAFATLTSSGGTITFTTGPNTLNLEATTPFSAFKVVIQKFTTTGTYTPTAGMAYCIIEVVGGGGGGGGIAASGGATLNASGGGGGGGYARGVFTAAVIGASQAVTIGGGGAGGAAGDNPGTGGGTTSVGALISATGGAGGSAGSVGTGISAQSVAGGAGTGGSFQTTGTPGGAGIGAIDFGVFAVAFGGDGGSTFFGGGGLATFQATGGAAPSYGGGGGGTSEGTSIGPFAGGAGAGGIVVITEYIT